MPPTVTTEATTNEIASIKAGIEARMAEKSVKVPGNPENYDELYTLKFRKGGICTEVIFRFTKDKKAATEAGRKYCEKHGFRFIWVDRFCVDINAEPKPIEEEEVPRIQVK